MTEKRRADRYLPAALALTGLAFLLPALQMPGYRREFLLVGLGALAGLGAAPFALRLLRLPIDRLLYAVAAVLAGLGLATLARLQAAKDAFGPLAQHQLLSLYLSLAVLAGGIYFGRHLLPLCHYRYLFLCGALLLMGATVPFGRTVGGAKAWLDLGLFSLQPSEIARPVVLFFLASYLGQHQPLLRAVGPEAPPLWRRRWLLGPVLAMWGLALAALLLQRDLGTAVLYYGGFLGLLYLASGRPAHLLGGAALGAAGCLAAAVFVEHARTRFLIWLHPLAFMNGAGFQTSRGLFALAAGGLLGVGPGRGLPEATPAVHTDLIFTVLGEELGLAGGLAVLLLYLILVARGMALAVRSRDRVGYLFGAGLSFTMGLQVLLIVGGNLGIFPLTGVTLPLLSYGGSSLAATFFCLGVLSGLGAARGGTGLAD